MVNYSIERLYFLLKSYSIKRSCIKASSGNGIACRSKPKCGLQSSKEDLNKPNAK